MELTLDSLRTKLDKLQGLAFDAQGQIMAGYRFKDGRLVTEAFDKVDTIREELDKINLALTEINELY